MPNFMLLATAWGPKHGGINAFNMDFAIGLANHLGDQGKVFCAAFSPTLEDIADAQKKCVRLLEIDRPVDSPAYDPSWAWNVWRKFQEKCPGDRIDWWVGHDVTTGYAAVEGPVVASHGRSATGWEAVAGQVPLIISGNPVFGSFSRKHLRGTFPLAMCGQ